jgi:hypothetical protein
MVKGYMVKDLISLFQIADENSVNYDEILLCGLCQMEEPQVVAILTLIFNFRNREEIK